MRLYSNGGQEEEAARKIGRRADGPAFQRARSRGVREGKLLGIDLKRVCEADLKHSEMNY